MGAGQLRARHPQVHRDGQGGRAHVDAERGAAGLGYWFFYGQDRVGPWTEASINYTQHVYVILAGYGLAALALLGAAFARWRHRAFFLVLTFVGVVIAVGAYPYNAPTPLGSLFKAFANSSSAGLALRSTGRAIPLVTLGFAVVLGIGVNAAAQRFTTPKHRWRGLVIAGAVVALIVVDFPGALRRHLLRPQPRAPRDDPVVLDPGHEVPRPGLAPDARARATGLRLRVVRVGEHRRPDHARAHGPAVRRAS